MPKIKLKNIENVAKALNRSLRIELNKLFRDKQLRLDVGDILIKDIKDNFNLRNAAPATVRTRRYLERYNSTDSQYDRNRIKALFSGALLNDLAKNVKGFPTKSTFEISHSKKKHPGYKTANGKTKKISYEQLSEYLINDYNINYFVLTEKAQKDIANLIIDRFSKLIKELNR